MKTKLFLLAGMIMFSTSSVWADGQVTLHSAQGSVTLNNVQNLAQLVTQPALMQQTWWRGSVIAERGASAAAQQQYQQTLNALRAWQSHSEGDRAVAVGEIIRQLSAITVTGRQFTPLDPDQVRLHKENNRLLDGSYDLYLAKKSDSVLLLGAVNGAGKVSWQPGKSVREYLADRTRLSGAENSYATVISPAGDAQRVPIAYWNHRHVEVEPGSVIWLGFSSWSLPGDSDDLNQRIISVLTHRVPE